jgi:hypothetical protein
MPSSAWGRLERVQVQRGDVVALLLLWVLPMLAICAFLVAVDLVVIAVALLAVEVVVGALTFAVRRRP